MEKMIRLNMTHLVGFCLFPANDPGEIAIFQSTDI
jgi:hypothetical protein